MHSGGETVLLITEKRCVEFVSSRPDKHISTDIITSAAKLANQLRLIADYKKKVNFIFPITRSVVK